MYDAVVLGLGGMGSAALAHLARRGKHVLGVEQFTRAHDCGSSAGQSRIIRMAYYEDPAYVPLLRRAYELWTELEQRSAVKLLDLRGVLMVGGPDSAILRGALESARLHAITVEELARSEIVRRYPTLELRADERGLFEPQAGMGHRRRRLRSEHSALRTSSWSDRRRGKTLTCRSENWLAAEEVGLPATMPRDATNQNEPAR